MTLKNRSSETTSRRDFLKAGSVVAATGSLALSSNVLHGAYADGSDLLKVGLVGCGGRGTGAAAQALSADPYTKLVAVGDTFADQNEKCLKNLRSFGERAKVPKENRFTGFDAYKKVTAAVDVVLLATPPHFRPMHLREAIEAGKHVFCEKPVAVDAPGCRSVKETVELARKKSLAIVSGLCWRYHPTIRATFEQVKNGAIGDIHTMRCSYNTRGLWTKPRKKGWSEMEFQVRNWLYYTWLSGDHIAEQHVHSLDKMTWAMGDKHPVKCSGTGGRQTRTEKIYGNVYDHFAVEYEYENGVKAFSRCRQQNGCDVDVSDTLYGSKGMCHISSHRTNIKGAVNWQYKGKSGNMYQIEHNELFQSIRDGKPINNGDYMTTSTMMAIMGRMSAYTGKTITWDQAWNSKEDLSPKSYEWGDIKTPEVAMPGITRFV
ncbi:MAG: Gfo/Idh/MocA family oxidoreductase [Planctomycetaceae bacterium]